MKQVILFGLLLGFLSCKNEPSKEKVDTEIEKSKSEATEITTDIESNLKIYDYDGLKPLINKKDDKTHVVNFWATWCAPCVKELPYFEQITDTYEKDVEVLLVSLDFPKNYESKLIPFIKERGLKSKVVAFDDVDQNRWIPAIDENWTGAIPATIIYNSDRRKFYEQSFTKEELENEVLKFLNNQ